MDIPKALAKYKEIQPRCVYKDEFSVESGTGVVKRKYKLAGYWSEHLKNLDARIFFVSTSKGYKANKSTVVVLSGGDYEECSWEQIKTTNSYYDVSDPIVMDRNEIDSKTCDPNNGFKNVAKVEEKSFRKLLSAARKLKVRARPPIGEDKIRDIIESLAPEEVSDDTLKDLHLI